MSDQTTEWNKAHYLVLSENFVEATDIGEALSSIGDARVQHFGNLSDVLPAFESPGFRPNVAFVSNGLCGERLRDVLERLVAMGTRFVMIDWPADAAASLDALCLRRPFSAGDLNAVMARLVR